MVTRVLCIAILLGLVIAIDAVTYKGVPQGSSFQCSGEYWKELYCGRSGSDSYGCFDTSKPRQCCGCKDGVCYACSRSGLCPSTLGKGCKLTTLPGGITDLIGCAMICDIFLVVVSVIITIIICSCCLASKANQNVVTLTSTATYVAPTPQPMNSTYVEPVDDGMATTTTVEMSSYSTTTNTSYGAPQQPQAYYYGAPATGVAPVGISTEYGGAGAGYVAPAPHPAGSYGYQS